MAKSDDDSDSVEYIGETKSKNFKTEIAKVAIQRDSKTTNKFVLTELIVLTDDDSNSIQEESFDEQNKKNVDYVHLEFNKRDGEEKEVRRTQNSSEEEIQVFEETENEDYSYTEEENIPELYGSDREEEQTADEVEEENNNSNNSSSCSSEEDQCTRCGKEGESLISCSTCPAMFHKQCLKQKRPEKGKKFVCQSCVAKKEKEIFLHSLLPSVMATKFSEKAASEEVDGFQILSFPPPPDETLKQAENTKKEFLK